MQPAVADAAFAFTLQLIGRGNLPANAAELVLALQHIPKQPEDTSFELRWKSHFSHLQQRGFWDGQHPWRHRIGLDHGWCWLVLGMVC